MNRSRTAHADPVNHERWLVSYADFITLLFAVFVVMFASSYVDIQKMKQVAQSIRSGFNKASIPGSVPLTGGIGSIPIIEGDFTQGLIDLAPALNELFVREQTELQRVAETIQDAIERSTEAKIAVDMVRFHVNEQGLVISLSAKYFFDPGKAVLHPEVLPIIDQIALVLKPMDREIRIEGHTDDVPIQTAIYPSNWELSAARATHVIKYLVDKFGLPTSRMSAVGYGEFRPVAVNTTVDGRARNRRVDIVALRRTITPRLISNAISAAAIQQKMEAEQEPTR